MRRILCMLVGMCCILIICACNTKRRDEHKVDLKITIEDIALIPSNKEDICAVASDNYHYIIAKGLIGNQRVALPEISGKVYGNRWHQQRYVLDTFNINIYATNNKDLLKTYTLKDIKDFLKRKGEEDGIVYELFPHGLINTLKNGTDCYVRVMLNYDWSEDNSDVKSGFLYINIDTDEMMIVDGREGNFLQYSQKELKKILNLSDDSDEEYRDKLYHLRISKEWKSQENSIIYSNGFNCDTFKEFENDTENRMFNLTYQQPKRADLNGTVELDVSTNALPKNNKILYDKFPELEKYKGLKRKVAVFRLSDYPTPEEILGLFVEDDKGISFENCILSLEYSKDGKEHEIGSFEELDEWYKPKDDRD